MILAGWCEWFFTVTFGFALARPNIGAVFTSAFHRRDLEGLAGCPPAIHNP
jgi:hypothetical protein